MAKKVSEPKSSFQEILDRLDKQYGKGTILTLNSKSTGAYDVISSGSIAFDHIALGIGGFAKSKLYELMGWEGTGKSTICGHAAANCQKNGGRVAYIDGEHAVDINYFEQLGVDVSTMLIAQPTTGEEGFNIAMEMINSGEIDLVIIDSDSSLIPKSVIEGEVGESAIGKKARLNSDAYPKLKGAISKSKTCVIVVSQYREKIGVMYGNPTTTQGGHALKFYSDVRIEVSKTLAKEGDGAYGNITKINCIKNKMSPPYRKIQFEIVFGEGIDKFEEIMELMNEYDLGKKWGNTMTVDGVKYDLADFKQRIAEDCDFYEDMKSKIVSKIKNEPIIEEIKDESKDQETA